MHNPIQLNGQVPSSDARSDRLLAAARRQQWSVDDDVVWESLTLERVARPVRVAMGAIYSHVYGIELLGLELAQRLFEASPEGPMREFAGLQVIDESRHVEFFERVLARLSATAGAPAVVVKDFAPELADVHGLMEVLLIGQVLESAGQMLIAETSRRSRGLSKVRLPGTEAVELLVEYLARLVGRDESRHIAFGSWALDECLRSSSPAQRSVLERRAARWCRLFADAFRPLAPELRRVSWDIDKLVGGLWSAQRRQFGRLGLEIGEL